MAHAIAADQVDLTVLFADISGSTSLYEQLGDIAARRAVADCLTLMTREIVNHGGEVIKTIGDELMCSFDTPTAAARAATETQNALMGMEHTTLSVRIGFHHGPVLLESGGDVFGDSVNLAARVAGLAKAGQIITTQSTLSQLPPEIRASSRFVDHAPVKGKRSNVDIFELIWVQEELTHMATGVLMEPVIAYRLQLEYAGQEILLDPGSAGISLGRHKSCDMTVNHTRASRNHARIEYRHGQYFLIDQSTNGTFIEYERDSEVIFLRRDGLPLRGRGHLVLGSKLCNAGSEHVIRFDASDGLFSSNF